MTKDKIIKDLWMALAFYGDPETYHATSVLFDPPCGAFREDFSIVKDSDYKRPMPGRLARKTLLRLLPTLEKMEAAGEFKP